MCQKRPNPHRIGLIGATPFGIGGARVTRIGVAVYAIAQIAATLTGGIGPCIGPPPI
jgi:hypothetical protein